MKTNSNSLFHFLALMSFSLSLLACGQSTKTDTTQSVDKTVVVLKDYGAEPTVLNIDTYTLANDNYRTVLWTGANLQVTLMAIPVGGDVGLEQHMTIDQFIRIEDGEGTVVMGDSKDSLNFNTTAGSDFAIFIPAGKWHNIVNTGNKPLKLYSIYAPTEHPHGTVHRIQKEAEEAEHSH